MRKASVVVLASLGVAAVVIAAIFVLPVIRSFVRYYVHVQQAAGRVPAAQGDWKREFGDPEKVLAAFPKAEDNDTAIRLTELARSIDIEMARPKSQVPATPEPEEQKLVNRAISDYVNEELTKSGGELSSPPAIAKEYLEKNNRNIETVIAFLSRNDAPSWERDASLGPEAPIPNLLGQIQLQKLLVAYALEQDRLGNDAMAERSLDAAWMLSESLRDRPEVISQLTAVSEARMQVGLARRISVDPVLWRTRFTEHDYRASLLQALEVESIGSLRRLSFGSSISDRASRADFLDVSRTFLVSMRDSQVSDRRIPDVAPFDIVNDPKSAGGVLAAIALPNLTNTLRRVDRLIIDTELTDRILQARSLKSSLGHWPPEIPGGNTSRMEGERWIYSVRPDGRMTIAFSRELHWQDQKGLILPLHFESM
jgi:hypothetical protein